MPLNLSRIYEYRFRGTDAAERFKAWNEIGRFVFERMGRPARMLDIGGGTGEFASAVAPLCAEVTVVDMARSAEVVPSNVKWILGDIFETPLPADGFDAAFASNLLEHLPSTEHIHTLMEHVHKSLRPGGLVAFMGPNFRYAGPEYFDCADHSVALTNVGVEELLYSAGFEIVESHARFLPYSFRSRLPSKPWLVRAYLSCPWAWPVLGKQFLVIGRKT